MATAVITSQNDPILRMVRDYNVIIADTGTINNKQILDYLNQHAFPRIRGRLITATDSSNQHIFYENIGALSNPATQATADNLVFQVMTDSIVKDTIYRIAAALAASWAITMLVGQLDAQREIAKDLQKEAMSDLTELVRSPELKSAVAQARATTSEQPVDNVPKIFMALDVDPATYDAPTRTARTYAGALEAGFARLWVGPELISVAVAAGEVPSTIMNRLLSAVRTYQQMNPPPAAKFNLVLGPNEGPRISGVRPVTVTINATTAQVTPSVDVNIGWLSFHAYQYDTTIDALFCTLELVKADGVTLGIDGLLYGTMEDVDYARLSAKGPYSVFIDVTTGKATTSASQASVSVTGLSDTFYFKVDAVGDKTTVAGQVRYQIQNLIGSPSALAPQPRTIVVPLGSSALDIAQLIARDMDARAPQHKVLAALRSPTQIIVGGTPILAPGLRIVPYRPSGVEDKIVVDILEVPPELLFGALPQEMVTNGAFDNQPKSLVLDVRFFTALATVTSSSATSGSGQTLTVTHEMSDGMSAALRDIAFFNRGY